MSFETKLFMSFVAVMQLLTWNAVSERKTEIESALADAAKNGVATFKIRGRQLTMLDGMPSKANKSACTVNLAYNDNGDIVTDWTGYYFDIINGPRRFEISDCSKLPRPVFLSNMLN